VLGFSGSAQDHLEQRVQDELDLQFPHMELGWACQDSRNDDGSLDGFHLCCVRFQAFGGSAEWGDEVFKR